MENKKELQQINQPALAGPSTKKSLRERIAEAARVPEANPLTMPNRIALLLDQSGSMSGNKIEQLKQAVNQFVVATNFTDTALAIIPFPAPQTHQFPLVSSPALLANTIMSLKAHGGTPMHEAMNRAIKTLSITRAVIVSDGEADGVQGPNQWNPEIVQFLGPPFEALPPYIEMEIPIDCVHIGHESYGEETLKEIAKRTNGKFIKFKDINQFAQAFHYLTPAYRALLDAPGAAKLLGADEVK